MLKNTLKDRVFMFGSVTLEQMKMAFQIVVRLYVKFRRLHLVVRKLYVVMRLYVAVRS